MVNWWDKDPVAESTATGPLRIAVGGSQPSGEGANFWGNDPVAPPAAGPANPFVQAVGEGMRAYREDPSVTSDFADLTNAGVQGFVEGIPVVGPLLRKGSEYASAGARSLVRGESFDNALETVQGRRQAMSERNPLSTLAGNIAGGVAGTAPLVAMAPVAMGAQGASTVGRMAAGAASGAALGGADAAVRSGGDLGDTAFGAGIGGGLGLAGPLVGKAVGAGVEAFSDAIGMRAAGKAARATAPGIDDLKAQSSALYQKARDAGVVVKPNAYRMFIGGLAPKLKGEGFDRSLHPRATAAVRRLAEAVDQPMTLEGLENLRRVVGSAASSLEPDERRVASIIRDRMDDWMESLPDSAISSGNAKVAVQSLREARALWGQARRGEVIEDIIQKAENSASGYENGLRIGFRQLANNKKALRGFSEVEQRAIRQVASGTPVSNVMKWLGKAAPTGIISSVLSGGAGFAMGGIPGAAAVLAGGAAARKASEVMTNRAAQTAGALARQGRAEQAARPALGRVNREAIDRRTQAGLVGLLPAVNP